MIGHLVANNLEDAWTKISSSDEYQNSDDTFKERVKQRFFERTVGSSEGFKSLASDRQQAIQQRFYNRIKPKSDLQQVAPKVGEALRSTLLAPQEKLEKFGEKVGAVPIPKIKEAGEQLGQAGKGLEELASGDIEQGKTGKAIAETAGSVGAKAGQKLWDLSVPATVGQVAGMAAVGAGITMAGETKAGAAIGKALNKSLGEYGDSIINKFRSRLKTPVPPVPGEAPSKLMVPLSNPLQGLISDEMRYEQTLKTMSGVTDPVNYKPYLPEVRTNLSQLKDFHKTQLEGLRKEPQRLQDIAYAEKQVTMPGEPRKQPPLIPFKQMLEPGREGAQRATPVKRPGVSDIVTPEVQHTLENMEAMDRPRDPFLKNAWEQKSEGEQGIDPDIAKFGATRNLNDITQKPLRNILKELNDDIGQIGAIRFAGAGQAIGANDPAVLDAAKDLRIALKGPEGQIYKGSFRSNMHQGILPKGDANLTEGFWDKLTNKFISREEAASYLGWDEKMIKRTGGLTAQNLGDLHMAFYEGTQVNPDTLELANNLRVAIKGADDQVHIGDYGTTHGESFKSKLPDEVAKNGEFGFWHDADKKFMSRDEAAQKLGQTGEFELKDLQKAYTTFVGRREKGLHSLTLEDLKKQSSMKIIKQINKELGEKGEVLGEADPAKYDRIKQNVRELMRRAASLGYDSAEEVIGFAARNGVAKEELHFLQKELGAVELAPLDPRPISEVLQAKAGNNDMKNTLWERVKDRWTPNGKASQVRSLLTKRYGEIAEGHLDSQYFIHNTTKQLSKAEREALTFRIEGMEAPDPAKFRWPNAKDIIHLVKNPTPNMRLARASVKAYMAEAHSFLSDNFEDVGYVNDYITHLWDRPSDHLLNPKSNMLGTYNPFLQGRSFPDYVSGINAGSQPKTLDVREILSAYDRYKIKAVANYRFMDELAKMPTPQGLPAVMDAKNAPIGWIKAPDVPALIGKRVHPDYLQAIKTITDAPFSNKALRAYDVLAESQRYASLSFSPFHFGSLFVMSSLSTDVPFKIPLKVLTGTGRYLLKEAAADETETAFWRKIYKAYQNGHAAFADLPAAKRAVRAGLNLGSLGSEKTGPLENFLNSTEAKLNRFYLSKLIKPIRAVKDIWDKGLWDYVHAGSKLLTFQEHLIDNLKKFPDEPTLKVEQATARFVNDLDGGLAWETLFVSPQYQKSLHRLFFFPDWMVSRLRTLGTVVKGLPFTDLQTPEARQSQKFWLRAGAYYYTLANWKNYVNTKRDGMTDRNGKPGRFMWDNDPGKFMQVYKGKDPKTGRSIYMNYAPAITEVFQWFHDPVKSLGARFNPNLQFMSEFFTNTTLSGYKIPENQRDFPSLMKRSYSPIIAKGGNDYGLFPASRGMNSYDIIKRFEKVIRNGDDPSMAIKFGVENGYDVEMLYNVARRNVKGGMKKEALLR